MPSILADNILQSSINDIWNIGDAELTGSITVTIDGDDYSGATPESPIYVRLQPGSGSKLADTLVLETLPPTDYRSAPINLALSGNLTEGVHLVAPEDTVSIVRWVVAEGSIWLRIQHDTATWLRQDDANRAPDAENRVSFTFGISASISAAQHDTDLFPARQSNIPFNKRADGEYATSTLICMDMTNGTLETEGTASLLQYDITAYNADARISEGTYSGEAGAFLPINFAGDFIIARGRSRQATVVEENSFTPLDRRQENGFEVLNRQLQLRIVPTPVQGNLSTDFGPSSYVELSLPEDIAVGFPEGGLRFRNSCDQGAPGELILNEPFTLDGHTLFKKAVLISRQTETGLDNTLINLDTTLYTQDVTDMIDVSYAVYAAPVPDVYDEAPFDGIDQTTFCSSTPLLVGQDLWRVDPPTRYLGHVAAAQSDFQTELILSNGSDQEQVAGLTAYTSDGAVLDTVTLALEAGQTLRQNVFELFDSQAVSHLNLNAVRTVQAATVFSVPEKGGVPAQIWAGETEAVRWTLNLSDNLTYDGLAVVNAGETATDVYAVFRDITGEIVREELLITGLDANAKALINLSAFASETNAARVEINADANLVLTALRGDDQSTLLWQNRALPLKEVD